VIFVLERFEDVLALVEHPDFSFEVGGSPLEPWMRVVCIEGTCNVTGQPLGWKGRKWRLSSHMTDGEIVQTAFMAVMAANEHETREKFTYRGVSVFDPHYDIEKLVELRRQPDALKERDSK
jgi:hypothetical protein